MNFKQSRNARKILKVEGGQRNGRKADYIDASKYATSQHLIYIFNINYISKNKHCV